MYVSNVSINPSSRDPAWTRLSAQVSYDDRYPTEEYWFEVPTELSGLLSTSGNPWAVGMLPLAVTLRQDLQIDAPLDKTLFDNLQHLMKIWSGWYKFAKPVSIVATTTDQRPQEKGQAGVLYSGGVDSLYTLLRTQHNGDNPTEHLLTIWGVDVDIDDQPGFEYLKIQAQQVANTLNKNVVTMATNIKRTRWHYTDWVDFSHGAALSACGLVLEAYFSHLYIASLGILDIKPHGSHPYTDPLFSSASLTFEHFDPYVNRVEKTRYITQFDVSNQHLRVCWKDSGKNCNQCEKCYRTMIALDLLGKLEQVEVFDNAKYDLRWIENNYLVEISYKMYRDLKEEAIRLGRDDVVESLDQAMKYSRLQNFWFRRHDIHRLITFLRRHDHIWRRLSPIRKGLKRVLQ